MNEIGIQLSPVTVRLAMEPGHTYKGSFDMKNVGEEKVYFSVSATPYQVDANYSPDYLTESSQTQIAKWISFDINGGELNSHDSKTINYTIKVPEDVPDGGQYATLMVSGSTAVRPEQTVQVTNRVGIIVYASVKGTTREEGRVLENNIGGFFSEPPVNGMWTIENTGNVDFVVETDLVAKDVFTGKTIYTNEDDIDLKAILPGATRYNIMAWEEAPKFGVFKMQQTVKMIGQEYMVEKTVLICPLWVIFLTLGIVITGIWLAFTKRRRVRKQRKILINE